MGEYFPGMKDIPANLDTRAFYMNAKKMWADVLANAPKDAHGDRMNIVQSNPIVSGGVVTASDIADLKLGVSGSDPYIFRDCEQANGICASGSLERVRQDLFGVVPLQHQVDATVFLNWQLATWSGVANPFGYTRGQKAVIQPQHVVWYHGSKGVVPLNSISFRDTPILTDDWFSIFDRFGPNGTDAAVWGQLPVMKPR